MRREAFDLSERLRLVGSTLTDAVEFYFKHAKPDGGNKTVNQVIAELAAKRAAAGRNADYLRVAGVVFNVFAKTFGERHIHTVMSKHIEEWLDSNQFHLFTLLVALPWRVPRHPLVASYWQLRPWPWNFNSA